MIIGREYDPIIDAVIYEIEINQIVIRLCLGTEELVNFSDFQLLEIVSIFNPINLGLEFEEEDDGVIIGETVIGIDKRNIYISFCYAENDYFVIDGLQQVTIEERFDYFFHQDGYGHPN